MNEHAFPLATWMQARQEVARHARQVPGARWKAIVAIILLCLGAWCTVSMPRLLGNVVDLVRQADEAGLSTADAMGDLTVLAVKMLAVALCGGVAQGTGFYLLALICERVIADLRTTMVGTALGLPLHNVEDAGTGDLVSRSTDDVAQVSTAVSETLPILTTSLFTIVATVAALLTMDLRLLSVAVVTLPIYILAARQYLKVAPGRYAEERSWMATRARRVLEAIHGRGTIRALRMEQQMHESINHSSESVVDRGIRARLSMMRLSIWIALAEFCLVAGVVSVGFFLVKASAISVGAVTAAALLMIRIRGPIMQLMRVMDTVQSGYASLARIVGVVIDPPQPVADCGAPVPTGRVELRDVDFSYPDAKSAVQDVSFVIEPGHTVALVGASGAGKSTIASLLMGLRVPDDGQVLLDGVPVSKLSDAERSTRVAMVSQEWHTFSGSLRQDLAVAKEGATDKQMWDALGRVGAEGWVAQLGTSHSADSGLDVEVGAMGARLEPVQAQQIALARVLLMDPKVVVMDEATAEAGSATAGQLELAAERVLEGRSALVVAHRLDQAMRADRVMVMEQGRIVESGTHDELLQKGGQYANLWAAWSAGR